MRFDIDKYNGDYVMHCKTEIEAIDFCNYLNIIRKRNCLRSKYNGGILWALYRDQLAINFNKGCQSNLSYYLKNNYTILEWEDFMNSTFTKADLKTGDVVKQRNGLVGIVNRDLNMMTTKDGWLDLDNISDDLKSVFCHEAFDIVAVRRPEEKGDCQFKAIENEFGALVYERKEIEEMTLEQVCALLGKEIKIIK
jgi:hypothetical protein